MTAGDEAWARGEREWDEALRNKRRRARWLAILFVLAPHRKATTRRLAWTVRELERLRARATGELADLHKLLGMEERAARGAAS